MVLLSGEPGIGKSRLIAALQERIAERAAHPLALFLLAASPDSALLPDHRAARTRRRVRARRHAGDEAGQAGGAARPGVAAQEDLALLAELLSLPTDGRFPPLDLTPAAEEEKDVRGAAPAARTAWRGSRPVLMIFEDVHWIDPSSRELLDLLIERVPRLPVLLLVTFRPEFQPPWTGQAHVTMLGAQSARPS